MLLLVIQFIGLFGCGLFFMESCRVRLPFFQEFPMAFLLGLTVHFFLTLAIPVFFTFQDFFTASVVATCIGVIFLVWKFFIRKKEHSSNDTQKEGFSSGIALRVLVSSFLIFVIEYLFICRKEIILATKHEGGIYQDFVNLAANAKMILTSGHGDTLISGGGQFMWNKQFLTNHFAAFFVGDIGQEEYFLALFCFKLFSFFMVIWALAIVSGVFWGKTLSWVQQVFLIVSTLNIEFLFSGSNLTLFQLFFNYSFSLQLSVLSLMMAYVYVTFFFKSEYTIGPILVFLGLFVTAMLIQLSSVIVIPIWGIITISFKLNRIQRVEFGKLWFILTLAGLIVGGILFDMLTIRWKDMVYPFSNKPIWFEVLLGLASIISFRILLIYRDSNKWLFFFLLLLMALFIATSREQAEVFYLPILVLLTFLAVGKWLNVQNKGLKYATLIVILCSMYPINTFFRIGNQVTKTSKYPIHYLN